MLIGTGAATEWLLALVSHGRAFILARHVGAETHEQAVMILLRMSLTATYLHDKLIYLATTTSFCPDFISLVFPFFSE